MRLTVCCPEHKQNSQGQIMIGKSWTIGLALAIVSLAVVLATPRTALCHDAVALAGMLIGWDIADLPATPSIEQQIGAGRKQLAVIRDDDSGLDSNQEVYDYFNQIVAKLLAASDQKPPYPIEVHVSRCRLKMRRPCRADRLFCTNACSIPPTTNRNWCR